MPRGLAPRPGPLEDGDRRESVTICPQARPKAPRACGCRPSARATVVRRGLGRRFGRRATRPSYTCIRPDEVLDELVSLVVVVLDGRRLHEVSGRALERARDPVV